MTKGKIYYFKYFNVLSVLALIPSLTHAQTVPSSVAPSHIEEHFDNKSIELLQPQAPLVVPPPETQPPISGKTAVTFVLRGVEIEDSSVYPAGTFSKIYEKEIGKSITLKQAQEIAAKITARYRNDGYILSQAIIPQQNLSGNILHIRVVEGYIDKVILENDNQKRDRRNLIAEYAKKIRNERPTNIHTLERYMLLINDLPGVSAQSVIQPSPSIPGAADLAITVKNKAVDANFTSDNRGDKYLGPYQEQVSIAENSLAGLGERTIFGFINTLPEGEMHYGSIQHEEQLDSEGTKLTLLASSVKTEPGDSLSILDLKGISDDLTATISHPFIRSRMDNLTVRVAFDAHDTENDALGEELNADRVRSGRLGLNYNITDPWGGVNLADVSISKGLAWPGATDAGTDRTRANGDQEYTKSNINFTRLQDLPANFSFLTAAEAQLTNQPLLQSEQMTLGGTDYGRAYDTGEIAGDAGVAGKAELRYSHMLSNEWLKSYQLYSYYDVGTLHTNDATPGTEAEQSLASTGAGVRLNLIANIYGYTEVDFPLTRNVASENDKAPRVFFSLSAQF